jgi:hypothetical protein
VSYIHWPERSGLAARADAVLLDSTHFVMPPYMTLGVGFEPRTDKSVNQFLGQRAADYPAPQAQHIHIVVLNTLVRRIRVMAQACINARHFIRCDAGSYTAAADQHPTLNRSLDNRFGYSAGKIGVIDRRLGTVGSEIDYLVSLITQITGQRYLERIPGVVRCNRNFH